MRRWWNGVIWLMFTLCSYGFNIIMLCQFHTKVTNHLEASVIFSSFLIFRAIYISWVSFKFIVFMVYRHYNKLEVLCLKMNENEECPDKKKLFVTHQRSEGYEFWLYMGRWVFILCHDHNNFRWMKYCW